jgi:hypothetical protein
MSEPNDTPDITPEIRQKLVDVVKGQCIELATLSVVGGVRDAQKVADFMQEWIGRFLDFNGLERVLILKFMVETEEAVREAIKAVQKNQEAKP